MMRQNEIDALLKLLDDPDQNVHDPVVDRLIEMGDQAIAALERRWELSLKPGHQEHIEDIIKKIHFSKLKQDILGWRSTGGVDLLQGAWMVSRIKYPELALDELNDLVNRMKQDIWLELNNELTALEKINVINHFLFTVYRYGGSKGKHITPQMFLINHLLDTRKGSPVLLGLLYAELCRRLELPVYGVNLPRNFVLCYYDEDFLDDPNRILFYINPFNQGSVLGRDELSFFLEQLKIEPKPFYFTPCSNVDIIERLLVNLRYAFDQAKQDDKTWQINELLTAIRGDREKLFD